MKLSIIVPVYNTEEYLKECLDSVTPQLTDDMEVILVNDGSTDGSQKICEEYQEKYSQVRLINQQNQGSSVARNTGIHEAVGDYLLFLDSDDFIATSVLRDLIQFANNQDIIFLDAVKYYREDWQEPLAEGYQNTCINCKSPKEVLAFLADLPKFPGAPWNKLVNRNFVVKNNLYFSEGIVAEDIDWVLSVLKEAEIFGYYSKKNYYFYRQNRKFSVTHNIGVKHVNSLLYILDKWVNKIKNHEYANFYYKFLAYEYIITLLSFSYLSKEEQKNFKDQLLQYSFLLQYRDDVKYRLAAMSIKLFGVSICSYLLRKYQNIRLKRGRK